MDTSSRIEQAKIIKIFYCYARRDKVLRDQLERHLDSLRRSWRVISWYDREIRPAGEWKREIDKHLNSANIILLLVSPNFMHSDYCYEVEMRRALERHAAGEAHVIPIILRPVDWKTTPIGELQALPKDGKAITTWHNREEAFLEVAVNIREVVKELIAQQTKPSTSKQFIKDFLDHLSEGSGIPFRHYTPFDRLVQLLTEGKKVYVLLSLEEDAMLLEKHEQKDTYSETKNQETIRVVELLGINSTNLSEQMVILQTSEQVFLEVQFTQFIEAWSACDYHIVSS